MIKSFKESKKTTVVYINLEKAPKEFENIFDYQILGDCDLICENIQNNVDKLLKSGLEMKITRDKLRTDKLLKAEKENAVVSDIKQFFKSNKVKVGKNGNTSSDGNARKVMKGENDGKNGNTSGDGNADKTENTKKNENTSKIIKNENAGKIIKGGNSDKIIKGENNSKLGKDDKTKTFDKDISNTGIISVNVEKISKATSIIENEKIKQQNNLNNSNINSRIPVASKTENSENTLIKNDNTLNLKNITDKKQNINKLGSCKMAKIKKEVSVSISEN